MEFCGEQLGLTGAEVAAVASFYTMYRRGPTGEYLVGVCTNTLCAVMGGDAIFDSLKEHLGIGNDETTADGTVTLQHIECNAACDFAPVVMVNWEFFDNQTPESARELVDALRSGKPPAPTRGIAPLCTFRQTARILAGFPDQRPDEGQGGAGAATLGRSAGRQGTRHGRATGRRRRGRSVMGTETPLAPVLSRYWDDPESWTLETYRRNDGYQALQKALDDGARRGDLQPVKDSGLRGRGGAGFSDRTKWSFIPQGDSGRAPSRTTWWSTPTSPNPVRAKTFR